MMNTKRDGHEFGKMMAEQKVYIGRVWPVWSNWVRVTVGDKSDMAAFKKAMDKVYA
jgi:histidinol-phosphate/aromatic aminotransferase/cobyric acid decarboxylase-like protein